MQFNKACQTPTIICVTSGESENSWARKLFTWLHMYLSKARLSIATLWWVGNLIAPSTNSSVCKTQHVQNTVARNVFNLRIYYRITLFPFNHYDDDNDYDQAIFDISNMYSCKMSIQELRNRVFVPFDLNEDIRTPLVESDPDIQYF